MPGKIFGYVFDSKRSEGSKSKIVDARVDLYDRKPSAGVKPLRSVSTDYEGAFEFRDCAGGVHYLQAHALGESSHQAKVELEEDKEIKEDLGIPLDIRITTSSIESGGRFERSSRAVIGRAFLLKVEHPDALTPQIADYVFSAPGGVVVPTDEPNAVEIAFHEAGVWPVEVTVQGKSNSPKGASAVVSTDIHVMEERQMVGGKIEVQLQRTRVPHTLDQVLWSAIRLHTKRTSFGAYREFINRIFGEREHPDQGVARRLEDLEAPFNGVAAYDVLKTATDAFLLTQCGVNFKHEDKEDRRKFLHGFETASEASRLGEPVTWEQLEHKLREYLGSSPYLPYIVRVIRNAFPWILKDRDEERNVLTCRSRVPCLIELIWSYWHEEGMLVQSINAVTRRFQNVRAPGERDPLAHLEIDPLRPLNNIIWGYIQDEFRRLTVKRRAYEYNHHYGLTLYGKAAAHMRPADNRSKFLEAFHNLLHLCSVFFKEDNDTTVIADGYPLLNALKEVHLLLAEGAHNQFGDLPWTARAEMLVQEWILARTEMRDFLQSRAMVPYKEAWMPQVDTMKTLQGWTDVTETHFSELGVYGEQILLSVRYGDWIGINDEDSPRNWARYWRPEIQGYLHAYRAVTGIDLTNPDTVDATLPAVLLQKRLAVQQQRSR